MTKRINSTVSDELFEYASSLNKGNKSYIVRQGLECLRLCRQLFGENWYANAQMAAMAHATVLELFDNENWVTEIHEAARKMKTAG